MFNEVKNLIINEGITEDELSSMAAHLLKKQFIFRSDRHYAIIDKYFSVFEKAFSFFGAKLEINNEAGFLGYLPRDDFSALKLNETAALLVLRVIYHEEKVSGSSEQSHITISGSRFIEEYMRETGRNDLGNKGSFNEILRPLRQKSIIRFGDYDTEGDVNDIEILPTIEMAINKEYADNLINAILNADKQEVSEELNDEAE